MTRAANCNQPWHIAAFRFNNALASIDQAASSIGAKSEFGFFAPIASSLAASSFENGSAERMLAAGT